MSIIFHRLFRAMYPVLFGCLFLFVSCVSTPPVVPPAKPAIVAVVLGAGASKGFAHIGVLKVLEAQRVPIHMIVGTSAGSLVGSLYASGKSAFELQAIAMKMERDNVLDYDWKVWKGGLIKGEKLENFINANMRNTPIEKLKIPYYAVATNASTGEEMVFGRGNTGMAVHASCSVPGVFQPVKIGNNTYVDGGLVSAVAVDVARRYGADVVIAGAVDFPLVEPILAGFATMNGAYRPKEGQPQEEPAKTSRPFSLNRRGFVVSEGAGCVILASEAFARAHGLSAKVEMAGAAMTSDASHFVAPNLSTVQRCIELSMTAARLQPQDIDAVNAHATSTKVGDQVEADALANIFGKKVPPASANKSQLGHAMGASSAIETILAMEGMRRDTVLPTINYTADPAITIDCVPQSARTLKQEFVLKNAFGFGGCNSCVILRRIA